MAQPRYSTAISHQPGKAITWAVGRCGGQAAFHADAPLDCGGRGGEEGSLVPPSGLTGGRPLQASC